MRTLLYIGLVLSSCATSSRVMRSGASVSIEASTGKAEGELFAATAATVYVCNAEHAVEVPTASISAARLTSGEGAPRALDPDTATWAGLARHPEGLPGGTSCQLTHEVVAPPVLVVDQVGGPRLQGRLEGAGAGWLAVEHAGSVHCLPASKVANAGILTERLVQKERANTGLATVYLHTVAADPILSGALIASSIANEARLQQKQSEKVLLVLDLDKLESLRGSARRPELSASQAGCGQP